jgi:citrate lyase subunit beta/citryl-CoA lyase
LVSLSSVYLSLPHFHFIFQNMIPPVFRSLLYVPLDKPRFIEKAKSAASDAIIFDLEDSISPDNKQIARDNLRLAASLDLENDCFLRINAVDTEFFKQDIESLFLLNPTGIILPKANRQSIAYACETLRSAEKSSGQSEGSCKIIPLIESALAIETMLALLKASPRVIGAQLGAEDLTVDLGIERTTEGKEMEYARHRIVYGCRAMGLPAYDTPFLNFKDFEALEADCRNAKRIGFAGKTCIHPDQTDLINKTFSPGEKEIQEARRILAAAESAKMAEGGAFALDGKMIDGPVVDRARRIAGKG